MQLNVSKCKIMDITFASKPLNPLYSIAGEPLEYCQHEKLLGVHVTPDLKFNLHSEYGRAKASKTLSFISRNLHGCSLRVKRMAYLTFIRPIMLYGTPASHPTTCENCQKLQRVQNHALKFTYGSPVPSPCVTKVLPIEKQLQFY